MDKRKLVAVIVLLVLTVLFLAKSLFADNEDPLNTPIAYDNTESSYETIEYIVDLDSSDLEQEAYTEEQIFFENAEVLYDYISFIDFEDVKVSIRKYLHANVSNKIRDCSIDPKSVVFTGDDISFNILVDSKEVVKVEIINYKKIDNVYIIPLI